MASKPICIITPEGMKCLSSPIAQHFPGDEPCVLLELQPEIQDAADGVCGAVSDAIKAKKTKDGKRVLSEGKEAEIARIVRLLIESEFDLTKPFTIVKA
jgi:hypothetical protein